MSSPHSLGIRRGSFLLLQEDPSLLASKGHGTLASLIRRRSTVGPHSWDDEEAGGRLEWAGVGEAEPRRDEERRLSILNTPQMRSMRLIGNANSRYRWQHYWKTEDQLRTMKRPIREYYARTNMLIQQYLYIDRLLDSSLPHDLLNEYGTVPGSPFLDTTHVPDTISEEPAPNATSSDAPTASACSGGGPSQTAAKKVRRTPMDIYRPAETTPLFAKPHGEESADEADDGDAAPAIPFIEDGDVDSGAPIVTVAIYVNLVANAVLLVGKAIVVVSTPSVSVLASLVDAVLDFLSTAIIWTTTWLISHQDGYRYPVGRRKLEPIGVLVFSVIIVTSFVQVMLESIQRLASDDRTVIELGVPALSIMGGTVIIKGLCWLWCRLVKNSSVQALAEDAATDVIFNTGSIAFPIVGFYYRIWWLDALGGLLLSLVVILNWSKTSARHIQNLSGFSASADQQNILLYLTMRFARTIKQIQGLQAYHAGDGLNVEVDIVLDAGMSLKDSHDLSESLQYVLESVPIVDRAFVHADYAGYNLPTHMQQ